MRLREDMGQAALKEQSILRKDYKTASLSYSLLAGFNFVMPTWGWLVIALLLALVLKIGLLAANVVPFNSDEAVVALMARHILQGDRPIFFYGQSYMGSLDAWLIAAAFKILGEGVLPIRVVQVVLYLVYLLSLWLLGNVLFNDRLAAILAVFLGAVPVVVVTTYTTATLGGYGETLVFGNLILWLGYKIAYGKWAGRLLAWLAFGLVAGLAFWTLALSLVYLIPVVLLILVRSWRGAIPKKNLLVGVFVSLAGFVVGSLPWWYANLSGGWEPLRVLLNPAMVRTTFIERLTSFILLGLPTLMGIRFPWAGELSPLPLTFLSIFFYALITGILIHAWRKDRSPLTNGAGSLLGIFAVCFILVFLISRHGIDATGRYLLPLSMLLLLIAALVISIVWRQRTTLGIALLIFVLSLNGMETARAAGTMDRITTQFDPVTRFDNQFDDELMNFLYENGELRGYTNYWVSFRMAFLSGEKLLYAARLPYKHNLSYTPADNRVPTYLKEADDSSRVAYITSLMPGLDQVVKGELQALGVSFEEKQIGPYHIFYALSRPVRPEEIYWQK